MTEDIRKGLAGVVVDHTAVSKVNPETNSLLYRGYPVQELAANCTFEEVAYLLWHGELPTDAELAAFETLERAHRRLDPTVKDAIDALPLSAHPMDVVRTAVSVIGALDESLTTDRTWIDLDLTLERSIRLFAQLPAIVAYTQRRLRDERLVEPRDDLGYSANFLHMTFGEVPEKVVVDAFDVSMILYAEHSFNASTFAARVITSTLSDVYSAVTGAIGALKGPLHGGANEAVQHTFDEVGSADGAREWLATALAEKRKIMGFGHRVYKNGDSRVPTMKKYAEIMAEVVGDKRWMNTSAVLAKVMLERKNIHPNLDFPAGPAYYLMGFDIPLFTPIFVASRVTGWAAHVIEQAADNRLIRPLSHYTGPEQRAVPPLSAR